ncbi:MAG: hypothetical protein ACOYT4_02565 [Nanoarchaeota archaeon]
MKTTKLEEIIPELISMNYYLLGRNVPIIAGDVPKTNGKIVVQPESITLNFLKAKRVYLSNQIHEVGGHIKRGSFWMNPNDYFKKFDFPGLAEEIGYRLEEGRVNHQIVKEENYLIGSLLIEGQYKCLYGDFNAIKKVDGNLEKFAYYAFLGITHCICKLPKKILISRDRFMKKAVKSEKLISEGFKTYEDLRKKIEETFDSIKDKTLLHCINAIKPIYDIIANEFTQEESFQNKNPLEYDPNTPKIENENELEKLLKQLEGLNSQDNFIDKNKNIIPVRIFPEWDFEQDSYAEAIVIPVTDRSIVKSFEPDKKYFEKGFNSSALNVNQIRNRIERETFRPGILNIDSIIKTIALSKQKISYGRGIFDSSEITSPPITDVLISSTLFDFYKREKKDYYIYSFLEGLVKSLDDNEMRYAIRFYFGHKDYEDGITIVNTVKDYNENFGQCPGFLYGHMIENIGTSEFPATIHYFNKGRRGAALRHSLECLIKESSNHLQKKYILCCDNELSNFGRKTTVQTIPFIDRPPIIAKAYMWEYADEDIKKAYEEAENQGVQIIDINMPGFYSESCPEGFITL